MTERVVVGDFPDAASAEAAAALLRLNGIEPGLHPSSALDAAIAGKVCIWVSESEARRVRWLLANADLTDAEYFFLTTGTLTTEADARAQLDPRPAGRRRHPILTALAEICIVGFFLSLALSAWRAAEWLAGQVY